MLSRSGLVHGRLAEPSPYPEKYTEPLYFTPQSSSGTPSIERTKHAARHPSSSAVCLLVVSLPLFDGVSSVLGEWLIFNVANQSDISRKYPHILRWTIHKTTLGTVCIVYPCLYCCTIVAHVLRELAFVRSITRRFTGPPLPLYRNSDRFHAQLANNHTLHYTPKLLFMLVL